MEVGFGELKSMGDFLKRGDRIRELIKHPKHKYLDEIAAMVNHDRINNGYKALPVKVYAIKMGYSKMTEQDMDYLLKRMKESGSPGKIFFGSLKVKSTLT